MISLGKLLQHNIFRFFSPKHNQLQIENYNRRESNTLSMHGGGGAGSCYALHGPVVVNAVGSKPVTKKNSTPFQRSRRHHYFVYAARWIVVVVGGGGRIAVQDDCSFDAGQ